MLLKDKAITAPLITKEEETGFVGRYNTNIISYAAEKSGLTSIYSHGTSFSSQDFEFVLSGNGKGGEYDLMGQDAKVKEQLDLNEILGATGVVKETPGAEGFPSLMDELKGLNKLIGSPDDLKKLLKFAELGDFVSNSADTATAAGLNLFQNLNSPGGSTKIGPDTSKRKATYQKILPAMRGVPSSTSERTSASKDLPDTQIIRPSYKRKIK